MLGLLLLGFQHADIGDGAGDRGLRALHGSDRLIAGCSAPVRASGGWRIPWTPAPADASARMRCGSRPRARRRVAPAPASRRLAPRRSAGRCGRPSPVGWRPCRARPARRVGSRHRRCARSLGRHAPANCRRPRSRQRSRRPWRRAWWRRRAHRRRRSRRDNGRRSRSGSRTSRRPRAGPPRRRRAALACGGPPGEQAWRNRISSGAAGSAAGASGRRASSELGVQYGWPASARCGWASSAPRRNRRQPQFADPLRGISPTGADKTVGNGEYLIVFSTF